MSQAMARSLVVTGSLASRRVLAERGGTVLSLGFYAIVVMVLSGLWRAAARANDGAIAGYSTAAITWYIATSEAATVSMNFRLMADIGDDIASGSIAVELLRPVSVLAQRIAAELGRVLPRLGGCAVVGALLGLISGGRPADRVALVLAIPSLVLAVACNIVAQHAFAGATFWLRKTGATWFLYQKLVFIAGGMLLPLQVLPPWLHRVAGLLPFQAMAYAPARLAAGFREPGLLLNQLVWLSVLGAFATAMFRAGERRLQVVGG